MAHGARVAKLAQRPDDAIASLEGLLRKATNSGSTVRAVFNLPNVRAVRFRKVVSPCSKASSSSSVARSPPSPPNAFTAHPEAICSRSEARSLTAQPPAYP